jgi:hypothetical protein
MPTASAAQALLATSQVLLSWAISTRRASNAWWNASQHDKYQTSIVKIRFDTRIEM